MASIIGVETLQHTNGTTAITIDSSGSPLIPNGKVPCFHVYRSDNQTVSTGTDTTVVYNANHFLHNWTLNASTGVVTAGSGAGGIYMLKARGRINTAVDNNTSLKMFLGSTGIQSAYQYSEYYDQMEIAMLYEISAGDTMHIKIAQNTGADRTIGSFDFGYHNHFFGYRISG